MEINVKKNKSSRKAVRQRTVFRLMAFLFYSVVRCIFISYYFNVEKKRLSDRTVLLENMTIEIFLYARGIPFPIHQRRPSSLVSVAVTTRFKIVKGSDRPFDYIKIKKI